ncbi:MAG: hypothetical protein ACE5HY_03635 [Candidatus Hydrothermarchaeales archaeon]
MISKYTVKSIECKRNIEIEEIKRYSLDYNVDYGDRKINKKDKVLEVEFIFTISYHEDIGSIKVQGTIYFSDTLKRLKEIDENWGKDKETQKQAINTIFVNIVAMIFDTTRHMGLPTPVAMPVFTPKKGI